MWLLMATGCTRTNWVIFQTWGRILFFFFSFHLQVSLELPPTGQLSPLSYDNIWPKANTWGQTTASLFFFFSFPFSTATQVRVTDLEKIRPLPHAWAHRRLRFSSVAINRQGRNRMPSRSLREHGRFRFLSRTPGLFYRTVSWAVLCVLMIMITFIMKSITVPGFNAAKCRKVQVWWGRIFIQDGVRNIGSPLTTPLL